MNVRPHCGQFAAFPKQNDRCSTNAWEGGEGCSRLELTEPLFYHDDAMQLMGSCNNNNNDSLAKRFH